MAGALYAAGSSTAAAWGAGLYVASAVLDHADGELARMTGTASPFGRAYDRAADLAVRLAVFVGMGLGLRHGPLGAAAVPLGAAAGIAFVGIFLMRTAIAHREGWDAVQDPAVAGIDAEDVLYAIAPLTWLDALAPFLAAAGIGAPLFALWVARRYLAGTGPAPLQPLGRASGARSWRGGTRS
jgi:phosphatidylglycerophosphate synthase